MGSKSPRGCSSCRLVPMACHSWPALFGRTSNPRSGAAGMPSAGARDYAVAQPGPDHPAPRGAQEGGGGRGQGQERLQSFRRSPTSRLNVVLAQNSLTALVVRLPRAFLSHLPFKN